MLGTACRGTGHHPAAVLPCGVRGFWGAGTTTGLVHSGAQGLGCSSLGPTQQQHGQIQSYSSTKNQINELKCGARLTLARTHTDPQALRCPLQHRQPRYENPPREQSHGSSGEHPASSGHAATPACPFRGGWALTLQSKRPRETPGDFRLRRTLLSFAAPAMGRCHCLLSGRRDGARQENQKNQRDKGNKRTD